MSTKALLINDLILQHGLDMIGLCETWLKPNVFLPLNEASPPNFTYAHVARATKQGGGVALIYKSLFNLASKHDTKFNSFESLVLEIISINHELPCPGQQAPSCGTLQTALAPIHNF